MFLLGISFSGEGRVLILTTDTYSYLKFRSNDSTLQTILQQWSFQQHESVNRTQQLISISRLCWYCCSHRRFTKPFLMQTIKASFPSCVVFRSDTLSKHTDRGLFLTICMKWSKLTNHALILHCGNTKVKR